MNPEAYPSDTYGALIVRVSTALGAIPIENAAVNVRGITEPDTGVLYSLRTDRDGKTPRVILKTPPLSESAIPERVPYSLYAVDVYADGYLPLTVERVAVFPTVLSVQPASLIPNTEYRGAVPPYGGRQSLTDASKGGQT